MDFKESIKERRIELDMTLEDVAKIVGVSKTTIQRWESGVIENQRRDKLELLAKALRTTPGQLMGWETANADKLPATENDHRGGARDSHYTRIPVLGRVVAGLPVEAIECVLDYEEIPDSLACTGDYFGLQIKGDSMTPRVLNGDVVIVRKQDTCDTGDVCIVLINGDDATCKRVVHHENGMTLIAFNPAYPPRFYTCNEIANLPVQIIGKVVELRGKF